jgi:hypothetical protein
MSSYNSYLLSHPEKPDTWIITGRTPPSYINSHLDRERISEYKIQTLTEYSSTPSFNLNNLINVNEYPDIPFELVATKYHE